MRQSTNPQAAACTRPGFTLVELLVVITILTVSDIRSPQLLSAIELTSTSNTIRGSCRVCPYPPRFPGFFEKHAS